MSETLKIFMGYILICLLWGSTWLVIKLGLESLTPFVSAGFRFSLAALMFLIIIRVKNIKVQSDKTAIRLYVIMGFFSFVIPFGLVYWAQGFIPSGLASILFAVYPFFVIIFTKLFFKEESINLFKVIGAILGFLGIIVIFSKNIQFDLGEGILGYFAVVLSGTMQALVAVMIKRFGKMLNPVSMNLIPVLIAGIVLTTLGFLIEDTSKLKFDANAFFSVSYLALFGTIATFSTYYWLMKRISVVLLSISAFITPIVSVILAWIILGETLTPREIFGSGLVLLGILIANLGGIINLLKEKGILNAKHH